MSLKLCIIALILTETHASDKTSGFSFVKLIQKRQAENCAPDMEPCNENVMEGPVVKCCKSSCESGVCVLTCKNVDDNCERDDQCCSNSCAGNKCICTPGGLGCWDDASCCSKICSDQKCNCREVGQDCKSTVDCCSRTCTDGKCACRAIDDTCTANAECCSQYCSGGKCVCTSKLWPCESDPDCCGGASCKALNGGYIKKCDCMPTGETCSNEDSGKCCSGSCNITGEAGTCDCTKLNARCARNEECCSKTCRRDKCVWPECIGGGEACTTDDVYKQCCTGTCTDGKCPCSKPEDYCRSPSHCCSGACSQDKECKCARVGKDCVDPEECCTNDCNPDTKKCACLADGSGCKFGYDCCSNICDYGSCSSKRSTALEYRGGGSVGK